MIYDHEGLEETYNNTIQAINGVLMELDSNYEHLTPELMHDIDRAYVLLRVVKRAHESHLQKWEATLP